MKLQAALDTLTLEQCIELLQETGHSVDIAEVGTPFIIEQGMAPVRVLKERFPHIEVLADAKIMDAGEFEADKCFEAGADIAQSAVAGGVKLSTIDAIAREGAAIVVVGGAICNAASRSETAREMKRHLQEENA